MQLFRTALLAFALLLAGCGEPLNPKPHNGLRIISMAPNITEILYALGQSDQLVGVSKFSTYPPEAAEKPIVGGVYDPNWEIIVALQPDLVIGLESQEEIAAQLQQLNIQFLGVKHERIDDVLQSLLIIGETCNASAEADALFQSLKQSTSERISSTDKTPRVLVCVGHDDSLTRMYIAAKNTFYDDLITLAGGVNVCEQTLIKYPEISPEGLRTLKPDIIIDIVPPTHKISTNYAEIWRPHRAVILTNQYSFIPGPRFPFLLEDFKQALHE